MYVWTVTASCRWEVISSTLKEGGVIYLSPVLRSTAHNLDKQRVTCDSAPSKLHVCLPRLNCSVIVEALQPKSLSRAVINFFWAQEETNKQHWGPLIYQCGWIYSDQVPSAGQKLHHTQIITRSSWSENTFNIRGETRLFSTFEESKNNKYLINHKWHIML